MAHPFDKNLYEETDRNAARRAALAIWQGYCVALISAGASTDEANKIMIRLVKTLDEALLPSFDSQYGKIIREAKRLDAFGRANLAVEHLQYARGLFSDIKGLETKAKKPDNEDVRIVAAQGLGIAFGCFFGVITFCIETAAESIKSAPAYRDMNQLLDQICASIRDLLGKDKATIFSRDFGQWHNKDFARFGEGASKIINRIQSILEG